ncbi:hypothetical protein GGI04_002553 [Coemansia thaxteri]|nr:hypothetical protein GGI04_002553 [Coemansia thaxteri]
MHNAWPLQISEPPPPSAAAIEGGNGSISAEYMVQEMIPLVGIEPGQQEAEWSGQLSGELTLLVNGAAAALGQSREQVFSGIDALIRARGSRGGSGRPRLDVSAIIDTIYNDESKRFFGRMFDLFRQVVAEYVKSAAADAKASASSAQAGSKSQHVGEAESSTPASSSTSSPTSSHPEELPSLQPSTSSVPEARAKSQEQASMSTSSTTSSTHSSSSRKTTTRSKSNDKDEDDDDEEEDDDGDDDDDSTSSSKPGSKGKSGS